MSGGNDLQLSVIIKMIDETTSAAKSVIDSIKDIGKETTEVNKKVVDNVKDVGNEAAEVTQKIKNYMVGTVGGFKEVTAMTREHFRDVVEQTGSAKTIHAGAMAHISDTAKRASESAGDSAKLAAFKAKNGIIEITSQAKDSGQELIENAEKVGAGIGKAMLIAGGVWAGGKAVGFLQDSINKAIELADKFDDLKQKTGLASEELAGLKFAAEQHGTTVDTLAFAVGNLQRTMGADGKAAERLRELGVAAKEPMEMLLQVAAAIEKTVDPSERAAIAQAAFGRGWRELMALGKLADAGVKYYGSAAAMAEQAAKLKDSQAELQTAMDSVSLQVGVKFIPDMTEIVSASAMAAREEGLTQAFTVMLGGVMSKAWDAIKLGWDALAWALQQSVEKAFLWPLHKTQEFTDAAGKWAGEVLDAIVAKAGEWKDAGMRMIEGWKEGIAANLRGELGIGKKIADAIAYVKTTVKDWWNIGADIMDGLWEGIKANMRKPFDAIGDLAKKLPQWAKDLLGIKSPSTVFAEMGRNVADGFTLGVLQNTPKAAKASAAMARAAKEAAKKEADATWRKNSIGNANIDLDIDDITRENEAIFARSLVLVKLQNNAIDAYAASLNEAAFAAADLQIKFNSMVDANTRSMTDKAKSTVDSLIGEIDSIRRRNEEIGLTAEQMAALTQARMDDAIAIAEQRYASADLSEETVDHVAALGDQIKLLRERKTLLDQGAAKQSMADSAKRAATEWQRTSDDMQRMLSDALMRGFEGGQDAGKIFVDTVKNYLKTAFLRPIAVKISATLLGAVGMGGTAAQAGGVSGVAGGGSSGMSVISGLRSLYDGVAGGFAAMGNSVGMYAGGLAEMAGASSATAGSFGSTVGAGANALGAAAAGFMLGKMISGGYSVIGKSGNTAVALGTAIGSIWGPIGSVIGGAIGGLANRAFGMGAKKSTGDGVSGTFAGDGFAGAGWSTWSQKGGWFRSDKSGIEQHPLSYQASRAMSDEFAGLKRATTEYADALGLPTARIAAYSKSINVSLTGLDEAGRQARFTELFTGMLNDMANLALGTAKYTRAGEGAAQTLERLVVHLTAVNATMVSLARNAFSASLAGADMANQLADMAGGMQAFIDLSAGYYQNFYSDGERFTAAVAGMRDSLINIGVKTMPTSIVAFRQLMEAQDLTTLSGRATYAALLNVSAGFAELVNNISGQLRELEAEQLRLAKEILGERDDLERQLDQLLGNTAALRERELMAVDPLNRALYLHVQALGDAQAANEAYTGQLTALASAGQGVASFIRDLRAGLAGPAGAGSTLTGLRRNYNADLSRAKLGDVDASNAVAGSAGAYLEALRSQARTRTEYDIAATRIANELEKLPAAQSYAQQQLEALQALHTQANSLDALDAARQEAAKKVLGNVDDNTVDLSTQTDRQIDQLRQLVGESITNSARVLQLNSSMDALKNAIVAMTAAEKAKADIANGNMLLKALTEQQTGAIAGVNAGIDRIWQLQSQYGDGQYINAKNGPFDFSNSAKFAVVDGLYSQQYGQHTYTTMTGYNNISAFKAAYAAESLSAKTLGQASTLKNLKDQIEAQRSAIRALGGIPQFAIGTNYVPHDMTARIHEGERIIPAADNSELMRRLSNPSENNAALLAELKALRAEVVQLRAETRATAQHTGKTARLLDRAMPDGDALTTRPAT